MGYTTHLLDQVCTRQERHQTDLEGASNHDSGARIQVTGCHLWNGIKAWAEDLSYGTYSTRLRLWLCWHHSSQGCLLCVLADMQVSRAREIDASRLGLTKVGGGEKKRTKNPASSRVKYPTGGCIASRCWLQRCSPELACDQGARTTSLPACLLTRAKDLFADNLTN
jgi:hypothetical protein